MEGKTESLKNRGKSSEDDKLFGNEKEQLKITEGLKDMYYLLSRDFPAKASVGLVGNRYRLKTRQIKALQGMGASSQDISLRKSKELTPEELKGKTIYLDGFNVIILFETLLSQGFIFKGLDGCYRDISSVHGTYKRVSQTQEVLVTIGEILGKLELEKVIWVFDAPVSNSGKMKSFCYELAQQHNFKWEVLLDNSPDKFLCGGEKLICSSDAWILNECKQWFNLGSHIINNLFPNTKPSYIIEP